MKIRIIIKKHIFSCFDKNMKFAISEIVLYIIKKSTLLFSILIVSRPYFSFNGLKSVVTSCNYKI